MDLRHVRTFVTVAELGTVSKAALHLRIAQPALSRQISDLEKELGLKLFDRVGRRLLLTGEGEQLLRDCRGLLNYATGVSERAQDLRRGDVGVLKVAATPLHMQGGDHPVPPSPDAALISAPARTTRNLVGAFSFFRALNAIHRG
jgi:DNA-binding transcriptional LysR family regulator